MSACLTHSQTKQNTKPMSLKSKTSRGAPKKRKKEKCCSLFELLYSVHQWAVGQVRVIDHKHVKHHEALLHQTLLAHHLHVNIVSLGPNTAQITTYLSLNCLPVTTLKLTNSLMYYWRTREASKTLPGVYRFELVRYVYICIYICMEVRVA